METNPYRMIVDLNVLDHLAEGLYSSVAAVITETVANAWDADATEVKIDFNVSDDLIVITDNGDGMDVDAINDHYLRVGYHRREEGDTTKRGRKIMGRKGIGKLSLFSIADSVEIWSRAEDKDICGLRIVSNDLRRAMADRYTEYKPIPISVDPDAFRILHGTRIKASSLKRHRLREIAPESLRRRLARRFSVIGSEDFKVFIDGEEVTADDREDLKFVEYLWKIEGTEVPTDICSNLIENTIIGNLVPIDDEISLPIKGWIGTVDRPRRLATNEGNLNSIVVFARGRLVDEDILTRIAGAEVYTKYVTGQIEADFLDDSKELDIVISNRQRVIEDDMRMVKLINFLRKSLREIAESWSELRARDKTDELRVQYPKIAGWLDELPSGWKKKAEKLLERIATMEIGKDETDQEEGQRMLLRHAVLGFERLRLRGDAEELERALSEGIDSLLRILADRDSLEATMYRDIVKNRIEAIKEFQGLVDDDKKERVLQKYLFDHLWLLDPAWERAAGSEEMERGLRLKEPFTDDDVTKEKYGRVDIKYRTVAGKHVIVELKRSSVKIGIYDLAGQGAKYVDATKDVLSPMSRDLAQIEVVFVIGKDPSEPTGRVVDAMNSVSPGSRLITYDVLIGNARAAYSSYLESSDEADRIDRLFS
ncbi:MAG: ATP-binding protein [Spirochaetes bacterium]|nr:ATP-binding protein [Spirochaetota bacterium]